MEKKKKIIIVAAVIVVAAIIVLAAVKGGKKAVKPDETQQTQSVDETGKTADESKNEQQNAQTPSDSGKTDTKTENTQKSDTKKADKKKSEEKTSDNTTTKGEKDELANYTKNLPTFIYFMSSNDKSYAEEKAAVEKLKGEYAERVTFMIKDVDGSEDTYKDLLGALETPALIMLDKDGNSTAIMPNATDYNALKAEIEKTLK